MMKIVIAIFTSLVASTLSQEILEVACGQDAIEARFNKQTAVAANYEMGELHFNDAACVFDREVDGYYVKRIEPLGACGTDVVVNATHAKFINSISSGEIETGLSFPHGIIVGQPENNQLISVSYECTYEIDLRLSTSFIPNITIVKIPIPDAIGEGFFQVAMAIYEDATYRELKARDGEVPTLQAEETVFVGITMVEETSADVFIRMRRCWATPYEDPDSTPYYDLIMDSCPVDGAARDSVLVTQNGIGHQALWQSKVFRFVGDDDEFQSVWLHCDLTLCIQETCEPVCSARRKRRSIIDDKVDRIVSVGPFYKSGAKIDIAFSGPEGKASITIINETDSTAEKQRGADNTGAEFSNTTLLICIGAFAAFCMLCLTIALIFVLMRLKRATRRPTTGEVTPTGTINKGFSI